MRITLRCVPTQSVPSGFRCVQHDMLRTKRDLTETQLGADSEPCLIQQRRVSCTSKQTRITQQPKLTSRLDFTCSTNREKNNKDAATRQQAGRNNFIRHGSQDKLDYTSRFGRVIPTFSQHCHITQWVTVVGVNMVVTGCSSQQVSNQISDNQLSIKTTCKFKHLLQTKFPRNR